MSQYELLGPVYQIAVAGVLTDVVRCVFAQLQAGRTTSSTVFRVRLGAAESPVELAEMLRAKGLVLLDIRAVDR